MPDLWKSFSNTHINKIQKLQNNALRLITFAPNFRDHITPLYADLNLLKIKDLISLKNMFLIRDYFNENFQPPSMVSTLSNKTLKKRLPWLSE